MLLFPLPTTVVASYPPTPYTPPLVFPRSPRVSYRWLIANCSLWLSKYTLIMHLMWTILIASAP